MGLAEPVVELSFPKMLDYLVDSRSITQATSEDLEKKVTGPDGLDLVHILVALTEPEWTASFVFSLPVDGPISTGALVATNFLATCAEKSTGWNGIQSIAFDVSILQQPELQWNFPFRTVPTDQAYTFLHTKTIRIIVEWPAYVMRTVRGDFRGTLTHGDVKHYVVGRLTQQNRQAAQYMMALVDTNYETSSYSLSIKDALNLFHCPDFPLDEQKGWIADAFTEKFLDPLGIDTSLKDPYFVLEKFLSSVILKEISGVLPLDVEHSPLNYLPVKQDLLQFTEIQIALKEINIPQARTIVVGLYGKISQPPIPFRLSIGLSAQTSSCEIAIVPDGDDALPIDRILESFGLSSSIHPQQDFPPIGKLLETLYLTDAAVGWRGKTLDHLLLGFEIDDWDVANGAFVVQNFLLGMRITTPDSGSAKRIYAYGSGTLVIDGVEVAVFLDDNHNLSEDIKDLITFRVATADRPLSVGSVLAHFNSQKVLPNDFAWLLEETLIDGVTVQVLRDASGWSLSRFALEMEVHGEFDIFEHFQLDGPRFSVDVAYPFDKEKRSFYGAVNATFRIDEVACDASLVLSTGGGGPGLLTLNLDVDETKPLSLGQLLILFGLDLQGASMPESLSFLLGIGLTKFKLSVERTATGKYRMSELFVTAVSSTTLQIWDELKLDQLSLEFLYSKDPSLRKACKFGALLSFGLGPDLELSFSYGGPSITDVPDPLVPPENVVVTTGANASWSAAASYPGEVSLLNALSSIIKVDIGKELEQGNVGLKELKQVMDIRLSKPTVTFMRSEQKTFFGFSAGVEWEFFSGNVDLRCSRSTSWMYYFGFGFNNANFFEKLGIHEISLTETTVSVTNGSVFPMALVDSPADDGKLTVNFSGKLVLTPTLKTLKKFVKDVDSIVIIGSIANDFFSIWAKTDDLHLFDDSMTLSGQVGVNFVLNPRALEVGLKGSAKDINLHDISSVRFSVDFGLYVKFPDPQLGLAFKLESPLEDAFGVKGLTFKKLAFSAFFQEFPAPSSIAIDVDADFKNKLVGRLDAKYEKQDLKDSYGIGWFTNNKFRESLTATYDSDKPVSPACVDGDFVDLKFWVTLQKRRLTVPQPDGSDKEQDIQGFYLKGELDLTSISFSARFIIGITTTGEHPGIMVYGSIKNAIVAPSTGTTLFALRDPDDTKLGPHLSLQLVKGKAPYFDVVGEVYFLGLASSTKLSLSLSGFEWRQETTFQHKALKAGFELHVIVDKTHFHLDWDCSLNIEIKDCEIAGIQIPDLKLVELDSSFITDIDWGHSQWTLKITASTTLVGQHIVDLNFKITMKDFDELVQQLVKEVPKALVEKVLAGGIEKAMTFLRDLGVVAEEACKLLVNEFKQLREEVVRVAGEIYALVKSEVEKILKDLGAKLDEINRVLEKLGLNLDELIHQLPEDFEKVLKDIEKGLEELLKKFINSIGGITPKQMKEIKELEDAMRKIDLYLNEVNTRNQQNEKTLAWINQNTAALQAKYQSIQEIVQEEKKVIDEALFKRDLASNEEAYLVEQQKGIENDRDKWRDLCKEVETR